jgi:hypothetical protein
MSMSVSCNNNELRCENFDVSRGRRISFWFFLFGAFGLVVSSFGLFGDRDQFAFSWLWAFMVVFTLGVGCLFWTILHTATDSEWGVLIRRQMENLSSGLLSVPLLFLPLILWCAPNLWKWWTVPVGMDPLLDAKRSFLNAPFFTIRTVFYFGSLGFIAYFLRKLSVRQDTTGSANETLRMRRVAIAGLPILAVSLTFAAVDWLMGLDYHWFSTMWGVYIFAGAAGSSMALIVLVVTWLKRSGYLQRVTCEHYHVMGKFLLAFTVFWAYIGYSQYMLIWYANIPEETIYFKIRNTESWHVLNLVLVVGRFFLPFPILLFQASKKRVSILCGLCAWIIAMQVLDLYIIVLPSLHFSGVCVSIYDASSLVALVGFFGGAYVRSLCSCGLFPSKDPRLSGSLHFSN